MALYVYHVYMGYGNQTTNIVIIGTGLPQGKCMHRCFNGWEGEVKKPM